MLQAVQQTGFSGKPAFVCVVRASRDFGLDTGNKLMTDSVWSRRFRPAITRQPFENGLRQNGRHPMADPVVHYRLVSNLPGGFGPSPGVGVTPIVSSGVKS